MKSDAVGKVSRTRTAAALLGLAAVVSLAGCGKKGPLIYPDMLLPGPPQAVSLEQSGPFLRLSFDLPTKDRTGKVLKEELESIVVLRKVLDERSCSSCLDAYQQMLRVDPKYPAPATRQGDRISWIDQDTRPNGQRYQYRIKIVQKGGEAGSVVDTIATALHTPPAAPVIQARSVFGGMVQIEFSATVPEGMALVGYQLYRSGGPENSSLQPLGGLLRDRRYTDQSVQIGSTYRYAARLVIRPAKVRGANLESELSGVVEVIVKDEP